MRFFMECYDCKYVEGDIGNRKELVDTIIQYHEGHKIEVVSIVK